MKKLFENKYFVIAARILLGSVFMYASFDKMANPEAFAKIIDNYHLLPYQLVNELVNAQHQAGVYNVEFNAASLSSGVYFYRLESNGFTATNKMILVK